MTRYHAGVLVDVDGTLLDTNHLHTLAWFRALRDLGAPAPMYAIHGLIGMGGDQLVPELLGRELEGADDAHARQYEKLRDDVTPFDGAGAFLRRLHALGLAVVIATSAREADLPQVLELLDADAAITAVVTGDDVDASKPSPGIFELACERGDIDVRRALAVGDTVWDVRAARSAGIGCVAVESGGASTADLTAAGALAVFRDVAELTTRILTSPIGLLAATATTLADEGPG